MEVTVRDLSDTVPPELANLAEIVARVEVSATFLSRGHQQGEWFSEVVRASHDRLGEIIAALNAGIRRGEASAPLAMAAFDVLASLTPVKDILIELAKRDPDRAVYELAKQLVLVQQQVDLAASTFADGETRDDFAAAREALLDRAGGGMSLTEAAHALGITRQALHKRITAGTALGMMRGDVIVVPRLQIVDDHGRRKVVPGLSRVLKLFATSGAGTWSALQFLIDPDPNLQEAPIEALKRDRADAVANAARSYLGLDEA